MCDSILVRRYSYPFALCILCGGSLANRRILLSVSSVENRKAQTLLVCLSRPSPTLSTDRHISYLNRLSC